MAWLHEESCQAFEWRFERASLSLNVGSEIDWAGDLLIIDLLVVVSVFLFWSILMAWSCNQNNLTKCPELSNQMQRWDEYSGMTYYNLMDDVGSVLAPGLEFRVIHQWGCTMIIKLPCTLLTIQFLMNIQAIFWSSSAYRWYVYSNERKKERKNRKEQNRKILISVLIIKWMIFSVHNMIT